MKKTKMLKKNYEFSRVFTKGTYFSGKVIEAFILNNRRKCNYLGLAISVKSGHAVQRNHLKRLLRESYYRIESDIKDGFSIVFLWKKKCDIKTADFHQILQDMEEICKKANLIIEK